MNKVIGPIASDDWLLMRLLKSSIKYMSNVDYERYKKTIEKEKRIYKDTLETYVNK